MPPAPFSALCNALAKLRKRRAVRWAMDGLVLIAIFAAVSVWQTRSHLRGDAPAFALRTLSGDTVTTATLAGKPALVVFWAPWCGVCKVESRNVSWVQSLVGDRASVVSVASEYDDIGEVRGYVAEQGVDYPVLLGGRKTARDFQVTAFPTAFFLDAEGRITGSVVGYTTTAGLLLRLLF